jgi:capsular exopolysaccharide synthesis family protein
LTAELIKIEQQQQDIQLKKEYAEYFQNYFKNEANFEKIISPSLFGIQDELLDNLIKEIVQNQSARNQLLKSGKENNPLLKSLELKIEANRKAIFDNIEGYKKSAEFGSKFNQLSQARINEKLSNLPDDEKTLFNLKRKLQINENIFLLLNQKKLEADVLISSNVPDFSIVDSPRLLSVDPIFPSKLFLFSLPILGFLICLIIASFLVATNTKIATKQDLFKIKNAVFSGYVGNQSETSIKFLLQNQLSGVAESFRLIKSNLSFMTNVDHESQIILTSSFQSGEGKSYVTSNLAVLYASSGLRTLFVGGDLRKSRIPEEYQVSNHIGLSTLLINQHSVEEVVFQSAFPNLFVIPPGPVPPNPSRLFSNTKISDYFNYFKSNYDIVIIDTAPLSLISDTINLLKYADITLLVIRQNYTPYKAIEFYNELIDSGKLQNCAVVFNDVKKDSTFYYRYGYQKGYYRNT